MEQRSPIDASVLSVTPIPELDIFPGSLRLKEKYLLITDTAVPGLCVWGAAGQVPPRRGVD